VPDQARLDFPTLGDGLDHLERIGIAPNVASFIGGSNLRILAAGMADRPLTARELSDLRRLVDEEMTEGALGIGTALIYAPGNYASTDELTALCEVVGQHDGLYISHLRSEGDQFLECLTELITIIERAQCRGAVYHLKAAGAHNHHKMAEAIAAIDSARARGLSLDANMYPYTAGSTALAACIPPTFHVGGIPALQAHLADPADRATIAAALRSRADDFENMYIGADHGRGILILADLADGTPSGGRYLPEVAALLGVADLADALLEVVARDHTVLACFFQMSEDNVQLGLRQPWVSIGSDAATGTDEADHDGSVHPRAYGSFARVLGHYGRDLGLFPLQEAIRRMTSVPAQTLRLTDRGRLVEGAFADVVVFDPTTVADRATYPEPRQYATGISHVLVNGEPVVARGAVLAARPGRRLRRNR
jgi:N-acyl-D-amino-acid deacylase